MLVTIERVYQTDCTLGIWNSPNFRCFTLELPDINNEPNISCIPEGRYRCTKVNSPSLGDCIAVNDVFNRTFIRIHAGNFTRQIQGCILVGESLKDIDGDGIPDVANSKVTLDKILALLPTSFELLIRG